MERSYQAVINEHLAEYRQMVFLCGPRQAGKTTLSKLCAKEYGSYLYLSWDNINHRERILGGIDNITADFQLDILKTNQKKPTIIFDEIHKYAGWKNMLKGYFDTLNSRCKIIVTGSAKLNVYRKGGDSMMGRYFLYRIHPLSVSEIIKNVNFKAEISEPKKIVKQKWDNLIHYGGFPEPYINANIQFYNRWSNLKKEQFFQEDLRDLSKIHDIARLELLAKLLPYQVGSTTKYSQLAKKIRVSEPTIREWINTLNNLYYCFSIQPWHKNITRSLIKEPKIYLWDWSVIKNIGAKIENLVACHLHKAVHFWTDLGLGTYELYYLRDKDKREVDFLITKDEKPWFMVEVKSSANRHISSNLLHFNNQLKLEHVFQVSHDMPFVNKSCFSEKRPIIVPITTLLSQLV